MKPRTRIFFLSVLAWLSLAIAGRCQAEDARPDAERIQGEWKIVDLVVEGQPAPEQLFGQFKLVFGGEKFSIGSGATKQEFSYKLDPAKKPRTLTATPVDGPQKGKPMSGIYELKADELRLCIPSDDSQATPTEFKSVKGSNLGLFVLKRAK